MEAGRPVTEVRAQKDGVRAVVTTGEEWRGGAYSGNKIRDNQEWLEIRREFGEVC